MSFRFAVGCVSLAASSTVALAGTLPVGAFAYVRVRGRVWPGRVAESTPDRVVFELMDTAGTKFAGYIAERFQVVHPNDRVFPTSLRSSPDPMSDQPDFTNARLPDLGETIQGAAHVVGQRSGLDEAASLARQKAGELFAAGGSDGQAEAFRVFAAVLERRVDAVKVVFPDGRSAAAFRELDRRQAEAEVPHLDPPPYPDVRS